MRTERRVVSHFKRYRELAMRTRNHLAADRGVKENHVGNTVERLPKNLDLHNIAGLGALRKYGRQLRRTRAYLDCFRLVGSGRGH